MYTNSLGQYFDKLSLNAASCQTADSTVSVLIPVEPELKDLKATFLIIKYQKCTGIAKY